MPVPANGTTTSTITVTLMDSNSFSVAEKTDGNLVINNTASVDFQELVVVGPVDPGNSTVVAFPSSVAANGTATSTRTVLTGDTAPFWRDPADFPNATTQPNHWNFNGESYFLIGYHLGDDMVTLLTAP